jgi:tetratricopeptide (TPR) repeat protein
MDADLAALIGAGRTLVGTAGADVWYDDLDASRVRLDVALDAIFASGDPDAAAYYGAALWPYWFRRAADGPAWLERARNAAVDAQPSEALAELQYAVGLVAFRRGDTKESRSANAEALRIAEEVDSERGRAFAHLGFSRIAFRDGDYAASLDHAARADRHADVADDAALRTMALHMRAEVTRAQGDYKDAVPLYQELLSVDEALGDERSVAMEHYNLGSVLLQVGEVDAAAQHLDSSLGITRKGATDQLPYTLLGVAGLAARRGDIVTAGRLLGAVQAHFRRMGEVLDPAEQLELASHVDAARATNAAAYDAAYVEGRELTLAEAADLVSQR